MLSVIQEHASPMDVAAMTRDSEEGVKCLRIALSRETHSCGPASPNAPRDRWSIRDLG